MDKKYIEIYRIEAASRKIVDQLEYTLAENPKMYAKTITRYQNLAQELLHSVELISKILQNDLLVPSVSEECIEPEFDELTTQSKSAEAIDLNYMSNVSSSWSNYAQMNQLSSASAPEETNSATSIAAQTMKQYSQVLKEGSEFPFKYIQARTCASLIYKWFSIRFSSVCKAAGFKYNAAKLPEWITDFVILFGKYHHDNREPEFIQMIDDWVLDIQQNPSIPYAVPYEIYQLSKLNQPDSYTIDAALISDVLVDELFYNLTEGYMPDKCPSIHPNFAAPKIKQSNPEISSQLSRRFAHFDELAKACMLSAVDNE